MQEDFEDIARHFPDPFRLLVRDEVASTNDALLELGQQGAADGLTLLAHTQHAGRGRRGANWVSPPGENLAFSILVRPTEPKSHWPRLALAAGLAVAEAVESFGCSAGIKWPNDVWIDGRKVAGILVEAGSDFAIVGIGINVRTTNFPAEIESIATSLQLARGSSVRRDEVLEAIIRRFAIRRLQLSEDFPQLISGVNERCVLTDHRVALITSAGPKAGTCHGVARNGGLLLETTHGIETLIQADEVRIID